MIDADKLAAFALVTSMMSIVPGPSMLFVLSQSAWRGARSGMAALAGLQLGYVLWWLLAGLGLASLALAFPLAFQALAVAGALYLAWLGLQALRGREAGPTDGGNSPRKPAAHAVRGGVLVALGNPKSLIYIVALLPPFVDPARSVAPQLVVLAALAMAIDMLVGSAYILAGSRLAAAMGRPAMRRRLELAIGATFIAIAVLILVELVSEAG